MEQFQTTKTGRGKERENGGTPKKKRGVWVIFVINLEGAYVCRGLFFLASTSLEHWECVCVFFVCFWEINCVAHPPFSLSEEREER